MATVAYTGLDKREEITSAQDEGGGARTLTGATP